MRSTGCRGPIWCGAVFRFLDHYPQVAEQVQIATVLELPDNIWEVGEIEDLGRPPYRVQLPGDLWQMLGIDPAQIGDNATKLGARWMGAGLMMPARLAGPGLLPGITSAIATPLGPASLREGWTKQPAPGGGTWLAATDVSGLASVIAWAGPPEPGTLHVGTPLDRKSSRPVQAQMLSLRAILQYVAGLTDEDKPRRVVLHQPWSHTTDGQAWASALGWPVTVPLADPDTDGEVWMVHSLRYRWLSPVTGVTYFPALPGAAPPP